MPYESYLRCYSNLYKRGDLLAEQRKKEFDRLIEWGGAGWQMVAWLKQYICDRQERGTCSIFSAHCISSKC